MTGEPGRVLALDPGEKRLGYAFSDPTRTLATPGGAFPNEGYDASVRRVQALVTGQGVTLVLVGLPLKHDGTESDGATKARRLARKLALALQLPVELVDESCTSVEADDLLEQARAPGRRAADKKSGRRDAVAAAVLLSGWLERAR